MREQIKKFTIKAKTHYTPLLNTLKFIPRFEFTASLYHLFVITTNNFLYGKWFINEEHL